MRFSRQEHLGCLNGWGCQGVTGLYFDSPLRWPKRKAPRIGLKPSRGWPRFQEPLLKPCNPPMMYSSSGQGRPPIWLYESYHLDGRIPGGATFTVKSIYAQAGLETDSAELPDHAALELAFLAFLCQQEMWDEHSQQEWREARRLFIKNHAGKWLPSVGHGLIQSPYPAWQAIDHLIVSLQATKRKSRPERAELPQIADAPACNLCGFCVQICPSRALHIHENQDAYSLVATTCLMSALPQVRTRVRNERDCAYGRVHNRTPSASPIPAYSLPPLWRGHSQPG